VLGAEAYGVNGFIRGVQEKLAGLGYAVALPDYYHGNGPAEPDNYDDFTEVKEHIGRLDFTRGARDLAATVDAVRAMPADLPGAFPVRRPGQADAPRRARGPARPHRLLAGRRPGQRVSGGGPFIHLPARTHA
jgi:hypothetical protein